MPVLVRFGNVLPADRTRMDIFMVYLFLLHQKRTEYCRRSDGQFVINCHVSDNQCDKQTLGANSGQLGIAYPDGFDDIVVVQRQFVSTVVPFSSVKKTGTIPAGTLFAQRILSCQGSRFIRLRSGLDADAAAAVCRRAASPASCSACASAASLA